MGTVLKSNRKTNNTTLETVTKSNRKTNNTTLWEQFQNLIEKSHEETKLIPPNTNI